MLGFDEMDDYHTEKERTEQQWKRDNEKAIASSNEWVDENGLPLQNFQSK